MTATVTHPARLCVRYEPETLDNIVGQDVRFLKSLLLEPHGCCVCLEGPTGVGKSAAANVFARAMETRARAAHYPFPVTTIVNGPDLDCAALEHFFGPETPFRFVVPANVHYVLVVEELEWMHPQAQRKAKDLLWRETNRRKLIVLATSNLFGKLDKALRHRFHLLPFSGQCEFALAAQERIVAIWQAETDGAADLPGGWRSWGWDDSGGDLIKEYSMRLALDRLDQALRVAQVA